MEFILGWLIFSAVAGIIASAKGRSGVGYFLISLVITPLVGLILAIALPRIDGDRPEEPPLNSDDLRDCPECAEPIRRAARRCKHCGATVEPLPKPPTAAYLAGYRQGKNWMAKRHTR